MNNRPWLAVFVVLLVVVGAEVSPLAAAQPPPNIVFILADDLGWGDLGCYGQTKIRTPNIDRLAAQGMRFSRHYSGSPVCAPSRCVLMTGLHSGHAFIRNNRQRVQGEPGQYPIPDETVTLAELLHAAGYATGGFGKWGLGGVETSGAPQRQGFDRFFGYNCQGVAHNFFPTFLWDNDRRVALDNPEFAAHQSLPPDADPHDPASYARYTGRQYSADVIAEQAFEFVRAHRQRPFFLYFPSTIPHLALQAPADALAAYEHAFAETPYRGERRYLPQRMPRACYAAMVSRLDQHVGRLLDLLDELQLADNTLIVFTSDNGPAVSGTGGVDTDFFGSGGTLHGRKGSIYEGGLRVPLIVRWPEHIAAGSTSDRVCGFEDWLPTLLELTGQGASIPAGLDGLTFGATLLGQSQKERPFLYREFADDGGQQAVWQGPWKAVRQRMARTKGKQGPRTELYNLSIDPDETTDVAAAHPEVVSQLEGILAAQHVASTVFPLPGIGPKGKPGGD
ncbi:MAG: arylsulfatase [Pirellulales bacterium]|nr:arylsulfatase [Pirellulales bacterium]